MKKSIVLLSILLIFSICSHAQSTSFGIKIGLNKNRIGNYLDKELNPSLKGIYPEVDQLIGIYANFTINNKIRILSEVMLGKKGAAFIYEEERPFFNNFSVSATYVNFPISIGYRYKFMTFETGIDAGIKLASRNNDAYSNWLYQDHKYDINTLLGIQFHVKRVAFSIRYLNGLLPFGELNLTDVDGNSLGAKKYGKNQTLQVSLTYDIFTTRKTTTI